MKTFRLYGVRLLVALLLTLAAYNASGSSGSEAGATWTSRTSQGNPLFGVAYGNGLFVAVGSHPDPLSFASVILTSPDGVTWTAQTSGTGNRLNGVAYGNGTFVAVGNFGTILTSPDGASWTQRTSGTSNWLRGVAHGNGLFVAVGEGGIILTSP